jgi:hypothetical protein
MLVLASDNSFIIASVHPPLGEKKTSISLLFWLGLIFYLHDRFAGKEGQVKQTELNIA